MGGSLNGGDVPPPEFYGQLVEESEPIVAELVWPLNGLVAQGMREVGATPGNPNFLARFNAWRDSPNGKYALRNSVGIPCVVMLGLTIQMLTTHGSHDWPVHGHIFRQGKLAFDEIAKTLKDAAPDETKWSSEACAAYASVVEFQACQAAELREAERLMQCALDQMANSLRREVAMLAGVGFAMVAWLVMISSFYALNPLNCSVIVMTNLLVIAAGEIIDMECNPKRDWHHSANKSPASQWSEALEILNSIVPFPDVSDGSGGRINAVPDISQLGAGVRGLWGQNSLTRGFAGVGLSESWAGAGDTSPVSPALSADTSVLSRQPMVYRGADFVSDSSYRRAVQRTGRGQPAGPMAVREGVDSQDHTAEQVMSNEGAGDARHHPTEKPGSGAPVDVAAAGLGRNSFRSVR